MYGAREVSPLEASNLYAMVGDLAMRANPDLIVLDKNPLDDIRNTRTIHSVYIKGEKFD